MVTPAMLRILPPVLACVLVTLSGGLHSRSLRSRIRLLGENSRTCQQSNNQ